MFVATSASASTTLATVAKISFFRSSFSGAASMTTSAPSQAAFRSLVVERRSSTAARSSGVTLPFSTPLLSIASIRPRPFSANSSVMS